MIKVFTTNKNGKIELTADELKKILDEAYWEGYRANGNTYIYNTPNWTPYCYLGDATTKITITNNAAAGEIANCSLNG